MTGSNTTESLLPAQSINDRHIAFVSGHDGASPVEVMLAFTLVPTSVMLRNLIVPWLFPATNFASNRLFDSCRKFVLDNVFISFPLIIGYTILANSIHWLIFVQVCVIIALLLLSTVEYIWLYREKVPFKQIIYETVQNQRPMFITYLRSSALLSTAILILAVDFPCMPRYHAKTETFGYSFMDMGVAGFCIINGLSAPELRQPLSRSTLSHRLRLSLPLMIFGSFRLFMVKALDYHEHVTEYGVHWNFFFTLAFVKIAITLLSTIIDIRKQCRWLTLLLLFVHQFLLSYGGLDNVVINGVYGNDERHSLLDANREGIISLLGFIVLYLMGVQWGVYAYQPRTTLQAWVGTLLKTCMFVGVLHISVGICDHYFGVLPSRRMANVTYILFSMEMTMMIAAMFMCIEIIAMFGCAIRAPLFSAGENPFDQLKPCIMQHINRHAMSFFVASNLSTGLINMCVTTLDVHHKYECLGYIGVHVILCLLSTHLIPQRNADTI